MLRDRNTHTLLTTTCCAFIGSLQPAASPVIVAVSSLHVNEKLQHFCG